MHKRERWDSDFYVEPQWVTQALLEAITFRGPIHDPAAGTGNIVTVAREFGYEATGSDKVDRRRGFPVQNFLTDRMFHRSLVFNAPYGQNEAFIAHALEMSGEFAALVRLPFLAGQKRWRSLYSIHPPIRVLILAERASLPPGDSDIPAEGGTTDYCWIYWQPDYRGATAIEWLPPRSARVPADAQTAVKNPTRQHFQAIGEEA
jgi:hypothetical protein